MDFSEILLANYTEFLGFLLEFIIFAQNNPLKTPFLEELRKTNFYCSYR